MTFEAFQDKLHSSNWRVEAFDPSDGACYVTIFSGPHAMGRAHEYAEWQTSVWRPQLD